MNVKRFVNSIFTSNSYLIYFDDLPDTWIVDPGDSEPILDWIFINNKIPKGILITHSHFDHIYGINQIIEKYSDISIYSSLEAKIGMQCSKLNASYYMEFPFTVESKNFKIISNNDIVKLSYNLNAKVYFTPGHNNDCMTFLIGNYLFTGDALIPGIKVHLKSKYSNKEQAQKSVSFIINFFDPNILLCPGHGDIITLDKIKNNEVSQNF